MQLADYRFLQHVAWIEEFIDVLGLDAITPVVQDWGSLIGLRAVGNRPDKFVRIVVANGNLTVLPEGMEILNLPDSLEPQDLEFPEVVSPGGGMQLFDAWATYALVGRDFKASVPMRATVNVELSDGELAAYDAPFPSRIYMAGPRTFPSLVNTIGDAPANEQARANLDAFDRPVLGCFGLLDPIFANPDSIAATREQIAGAAGQPHRDYPDAGHMIQADAGADLAAHIAAWMHDTPHSTA